MSQVASDFWVFFLIFVWSTKYIFDRFFPVYVSVCVWLSVYVHECVGECVCESG